MAQVEMSNEQMIAMVKAIVQEMKEPSAAEKKKLEEEAAVKAKQREEMIRLAADEMATRKREQDACAHMRPNGSRCLGGQVHKDRVILICLRCQKVVVNRQASHDDHQNGPMELLVENAPRIAQVA